mmetsp:Transcript_3786/g.14027  ORF Transcript_3786/g.14027 Transcript_3786/m.14027 type:complete len:212 (+) Transcript_3786:1401-2036(+)
MHERAPPGSVAARGSVVAAAAAASVRRRAGAYSGHHLGGRVPVQPRLDGLVRLPLALLGGSALGRHLGDESDDAEVGARDVPDVGRGVGKRLLVWLALRRLYACVHGRQVGGGREGVHDAERRRRQLLIRRRAAVHAFSQEHAAGVSQVGAARRRRRIAACRFVRTARVRCCRRRRRSRRVWRSGRRPHAPPSLVPREARHAGEILLHLLD